MSSSTPAEWPQIPSPEQQSSGLEQIQQGLHRLERRDWWLWTMAIIVMLVLTFAVFSMSFPGLIVIDDPFFRFTFNRAVRGLIILVIMFNGYAIYQQKTIKRLRREFSKKLEEMRELQIRAEEFHRLAVADPLTGLSNRRIAEERLAIERSRSMRHGYPLTLVVFDLNDFKRINDTYGHGAGDAVLKGFAARLSSAIRLSDLAARMGGDEFLVLLPECPVDRVETLLSRLRLRPLEFEYAGRKIPVSFSAGWVAFEHPESVAQFLERADHMLYEHKRAAKAQLAANVPVT